MNIDIVIVNQIDTGTSFAARVDNGEGVFVPALLSKNYDLQVSSTYNVVAIPNADDRRGSLPWRAVRINTPAHDPEPEPQEPEPLTADELMEYLPDHPFSAAEIAQEAYDGPSDEEAAEVFEMLTSLVERGRIARRTIDVGPLTEVRYARKLDDLK